MADDRKKDQSKNPGQSGQSQHKNDVPSKKNPTPDTTQQDKQKQQDQGGQRRAS